MSIVENKILTELDIALESNSIRGFNRFDAYYPKFNTFIEVDGAPWHKSTHVLACSSERKKFVKQDDRNKQRRALVKRLLVIQFNSRFCWKDEQILARIPAFAEVVRDQSWSGFKSRSFGVNRK